MKRSLFLVCFALHLKVWTQVFPVLHERHQLDFIEISSGKLLETHQSILPEDHLQLVRSVFERRTFDSVKANRYLRNHIDDGYQMKDTLLNSHLELLMQSGFKGRYLFKDGRHALSIYHKDFQFTLDPLIDLQVGSQTAGDEILWTNRHGIRLQASLDQKVSFYSDITDNQMSVPFYVDSFVQMYQAFPGVGLFKNYKSSILKINKGHDFLLAEGAVNFKLSNHIQTSLGHGRHFIGSGMRSLFLSDFSGPQFYLRVNTNIWKLHYQNLFVELSPETLGDKGNRLLPKKYAASHYLSIQLSKKWNIGLFETVVFARDKGFELQYLNPVILYRFIEHAIGSPDNVMLGIHSNVLLGRSLSFYTQILFDEFLLKEIIRQDGWWGNKYGFQFGLKYINALNIKDLRLQFETNWVRPYTYTFRDSFANYSHFNQALAHPLGANFKEFIFAVDYSFSNRFHMESKTIYYQKGLDDAQFNYGGNILKDYTTRKEDYNNTIAQGILNTTLTSSLSFYYEVLPATYFDLHLNYRYSKISQTPLTKFWFNAGFRMNLDNFRFDF